MNIILMYWSMVCGGGRILVNEGAVEGVLKEGRMLRYSMVDLATLSFKEQLKVGVYLVFECLAAVLSN
jgi:hypothetical protein